MSPTILVAAVLLLLSRPAAAQNLLLPKNISQPAFTKISPNTYSAALNSGSFEENRGQAPEGVEFFARRGPAILSFSRGGAALSRCAAREKPCAYFQLSAGGRDAALARPEGEELLGVSNNYYLGGDPAAWKTGVRSYRRVRYKRLYPGIDLVFHTLNDENTFEYDFEVAPGADPKRILLHFPGSESAEITAEGDLIIGQREALLRQRKPDLFQIIDGQRTEVAGEWMAAGGGNFGFAVTGNYNSSYPLIIDPTIEWSTFFGGSQDDRASAVAHDGAGNVYVLGWTSSGDFPLKDGQLSGGGSYDVIVAKFSAAGALVFSSRLGGSKDETGSDLFVDSGGNAYIAGSTDSSDFPTTPGAYLRAAPGGGDSFVTKIDPDGRLDFSTYIGGPDDDRAASAVSADASGAVYFAGSLAGRASAAPFSFPVLNAFQGSVPPYGYCPASWDTSGMCGAAVFGKLSADGSKLLFASYFGRYTARAADIAAVQDGFIITGSQAFADPLVDPWNTGYGNGFVAKFSPDGAVLLFSNYYWGQGSNLRSMAVHNDGTIFVAGRGNVIPVAGGFQTANAGLADALILRLSAAGVLEFSSYLGGTGPDGANDIAVDSSKNIYVCGYTYSKDFPSVFPIDKCEGQLPSASGASSDAFVARISSTGTILYSTCLTRKGDEEAASVSVHSPDEVYLLGTTWGPDFHIRRAYQTSFGGVRDIFLLKLGMPYVFLR